MIKIKYWKLLQNTTSKYTERFDTCRDLPDTNYSKILYYIDFFLAYIIHGASVSDYFNYQFYFKKYTERKNFITATKAMKYHETLNLGTEKIDNKVNSYRLFEDFIGREYLDIQSISYEKFQLFCETHKKFVVKPNDGIKGIGVEVIYIQGGDDLEVIYHDLYNKKLIIEEYVNQHIKISKLHPSSVNTIRVNTLIYEESPVVMSAVLRVGAKGADIDNHSAGGIASSIDIETGRVYTTGVNPAGERFVNHPITGESIVGFKVPFWEETIKIVKKMALTIPEIRYVGWDIAITTNGPILIEANSNAGFNIQQFPNQKGIYPLYKKYID